MIPHGPASRAAPPLSWLRFHPFLMLAGYGLIGAAAPAPPPRAPAPTLERMVAICKLPPDDAQRAILALPEHVQAAALLLCIGYQRGQLDLLEQIQGRPEKRVSI